MATLDGEINCLSQQVQSLILEKEAMMKCSVLQDDQIIVEISRRKPLEADLAWVLQKCVIRVGDRFFKSDVFAVGVCRMKAKCVVAGILSGKQMPQVWLGGNSLFPSELDAVARSVDAM